MTANIRMMYMLPATTTLAPRASGQLVFTISPGFPAEKWLTPRRITVNETPDAHLCTVPAAIPAALPTDVTVPARDK